MNWCYNYKTVLKKLNYEESMELLEEQLEYLKGLKNDVLKANRQNKELQLYRIDSEIDYCKKVMATVKIWRN